MRAGAAKRHLSALLALATSLGVECSDDASSRPDFSASGYRSVRPFLTASGIAVTTSSISLFSRLLSTRDARRSKDGVKGHEEYLTQIMAFLLQQDEALARSWIGDWFGVRGATDIAVLAENTEDARSLGGTEYAVDLVVTFDGAGRRHRAYVENKVEAKLNQYDDGDGGKEDQVKAYADQLVRMCEKRREVGHLILCALRPQEDERGGLFAEASRCQWHKPRFWWDFYEIVRDHVAAGASSGEALWLQEQFLAFSEEKRLSTPRALDPARFDVEDAARLLGLGAIKSAAASKIRVSTSQDAQTATVYFKARMPVEETLPNYWVSLRFADGGITSRAFWEKVGDLAAPVGPGFWRPGGIGVGAMPQIEDLGDLIRDLPRDDRHFAAFLSAFGDDEPVARAVVERLRAVHRVWVHPRGTEITARSLRFPTGVCLKLCRTPTNGSEFIVQNSGDGWPGIELILRELLGPEMRRTKLLRCYPLVHAEACAAQVARALMQLAASA